MALQVQNQWCPWSKIAPKDKISLSSRKIVYIGYRILGCMDTKCRIEFYYCCWGDGYPVARLYQQQSFRKKKGEILQPKFTKLLKIFSQLSQTSQLPLFHSDTHCFWSNLQALTVTHSDLTACLTVQLKDARRSDNTIHPPTTAHIDLSTSTG